MPDEQHDQHAGYCTTIPRSGDRLADACPDCGHATALHIGTDHCPVCEMVGLNQQARTATVNTTVVVNHADQAWAEVQRRHELGLARAPYPHRF